MTGPELEDGWLEASVAEELPGLRLWQSSVQASAGRSSPAVRERLAYLSRRMTGAEAVAARTRPIPQAYRQLFRQIGLDPDEHRTPFEAAILDRLVKGGYDSLSRLDDALTVAVVETGVPVWALDHALLDGPLGLRQARAGEHLGNGDYADEVPAGRLVVADAEMPVAVLFGKLAPSHAVSGATAIIRLFAVQASGVPDIHVSEALWTCLECLNSG
jgi:DNA/RNA-binding domain of Phe-tRNA-synthetase-like protein